MKLQSAFFSVLLLGSGACAELDSGDTDNLDQASVSSNNLWEQRDIEVCFADADFNTFKRALKKTLRGQRSWSRTADLNFVGFGSCQQSDPSGIKIEFSTAMEEVSSIGPENGRLTMSLNPSRLSTSTTFCTGLSNLECQLSVSLHEFGHAVGFYHEYERPDNPLNCNAGMTPDDAELLTVFDQRSIMNHICGGPPNVSPLDHVGAVLEYGLAYERLQRTGDFDGDGRSDRLCHNVVTGLQRKWQSVGGSQWAFSACREDRQQLYLADLDGDGRDEQACHDRKKDMLSTNSLAVEDMSCNQTFHHLLIGDFDGNGRADLLCHNEADGEQRLDLDTAERGYDAVITGWCKGSHQQLLVGNFDGKNGDDLACRNRLTSTFHVRYSDSRGEIGPVALFSTVGCAGPLRVGDFDGDGRDDLVCHSAETGSVAINLAVSGSGGIGTTNWSYPNAAYCLEVGDQLMVGDYDGSKKDELLCHNVISGESSTATVVKSLSVTKATRMCNAAGDQLY